jgi:hypothetical protein
MRAAAGFRQPRSRPKVRRRSASVFATTAKAIRCLICGTAPSSWSRSAVQDGHGPSKAEARRLRSTPALVSRRSGSAETSCCTPRATGAARTGRKASPHLSNHRPAPRGIHSPAARRHWAAVAGAGPQRSPKLDLRHEQFVSGDTILCCLVRECPVHSPDQSCAGLPGAPRPRQR